VKGVLHGSTTITITDDASSTLAAATIKGVDDVTGTVTITNVNNSTFTVTGDYSGVNGVSSLLGVNTAVTLSDSSLAAADINTLNASVGVITMTAATSITGSAAQLEAIGDADDAGTILAYVDSGTEAYDAIFSGIADLQEFQAIDGDTSGELDFSAVGAYLELAGGDGSDFDLSGLSSADNLTIIDLTNGTGNIISGVSTLNILKVTGGNKAITIDGDDEDFIQLVGSWSTTINESGDKIYTNGDYTITDLSNAGLMGTV